MRPGENCYISGYKGPNEIYEVFPETAQTILSVVEVSDLGDETVTRGRPYNFVVLNSPVTGNLWKRIINPNWQNQF